MLLDFEASADGRPNNNSLEDSKQMHVHGTQVFC